MIFKIWLKLRRLFFSIKSSTINTQFKFCKIHMVIPLFYLHFINLNIYVNRHPETILDPTMQTSNCWQYHTHVCSYTRAHTKYCTELIEELYSVSRYSLWCHKALMLWWGYFVSLVYNSKRVITKCSDALKFLFKPTFIKEMLWWQD